MKPISGKRFCRLLEDKSWKLKRINGSHHIYAKAGMNLILHQIDRTMFRRVFHEDLMQIKEALGDAGPAKELEDDVA